MQFSVTYGPGLWHHVRMDPLRALAFSGLPGYGLVGFGLVGYGLVGFGLVDR